VYIYIILNISVVYNDLYTKIMFVIVYNIYLTRLNGITDFSIYVSWNRSFLLTLWKFIILSKKNEIRNEKKKKKREKK